MRLLGIDPNGFAQRIQSQMAKLLAADRLEHAPKPAADAPPRRTPSTPHKVSVRHLPLPQPVHPAAPGPSSAQTQRTALGGSPADPVATRAIAQFTQGQSDAIATDTPQGAPDTGSSVAEAPALFGLGQLALAVKSSAPWGALTGGLAGRITATLARWFKTYDAAVRTAAVLLIALGFALTIAVM
ncbi:MAG: hypothetical protein ACR2PI_15450 [Hyphomicrobiaceae bacterium]